MHCKIPLPVALLCFLLIVFDGNAQEAPISFSDLKDKIAGGWAGKMLGVTYGAPVEFRAQGVTFNEAINWKPSDVIGSTWQDDLYVQLTFLMTMDSFGIDAPPRIFQEMFAKSGYPLWHANVQARKNYFDGIYPPASGSPEYNLHADDIDFQIEADYLGLMCPGMPQTASELASGIGHIMNYGDGVYGGVFISALYSYAFFEEDMRTIVEKALKTIPSESEYARTIQDVLRLHQHFPADWKSAWKELYDKWGYEHICEAGNSFNIDAKINGAFVALGLLYGNGDPLKTMEIATRCGQDADCNPSSAMGVVGVVKGFRGLPEDYRNAITAMQDSVFINTHYTFRKAVDRTFHYALELARKNGARSDDQGITIKLQQVKPLPLEASFPETIFGSRSAVDDASAWKFQGDWHDSGSITNPVKTGGKLGDECSFTFFGTGVSLTGNWVKNGGKADVYIDGQFVRTIDCYFNYAKQEHQDCSVFHTLGLPTGDHVLRVVVKGEKRAGSSGSEIQLSGAIVYFTEPKPDARYKFSFEK